MEGSLLFVLCLLLGSLRIVFTGTGGELCRAWNYGLDPLLGPFQCPERLDDIDARFCCGTCSAPYCCSSGEARLDPAQCSLAAPQKEEAGPALPSPVPTLVVYEFGSVWLEAAFWLTIIILAVLVIHCLCRYSGFLNWLQSKRWERTRQEEAEPTELDDLRPLPRPRAQAMSRVQAIARLRAMSFHPPPPPPPPPPPYELSVASVPASSDPPPPYSSLDFGSTPVLRSSEQTPEEVVTIVPSTSTGVSGVSLEPVHKIETTV